MACWTECEYLHTILHLVLINGFKFEEIIAAADQIQQFFLKKVWVKSVMLYPAIVKSNLLYHSKNYDILLIYCINYCANWMLKWPLLICTHYSTVFCVTMIQLAYNIALTVSLDVCGVMRFYCIRLFHVCIWCKCRVLKKRIKYFSAYTYLAKLCQLFWF